MGMQTDVLASKVRTDAVDLLDQNSLVIGRSRVKAIYIVPDTGAGTVTFRDGGASGPVKIVLNTKASSTSADYTLMPGEGLLFQTSIYIVPSAVVSTLVIYG